MTKEFQENTVAIILNELFKDSKELKTQMQFDALIEKYAERVVKLFFIPDVSQRSELFFAFLKWAKQADLEYPDEMLLKDFEQFNAKNCG